MDQGYVINLDSMPDRWRKIQERFKDSNVQLHRVSAIEKRPGAYGLLLTAIKILENAKEKGLDAILMLEDDCMPTPGWQERWELIKQWLTNHPTLWDIYSGGSTYYNSPKEVGHIDYIRFFQPKNTYAAHWVYIPARSYDMMIKIYTKHLHTTRVRPSVGIDIIHRYVKRVISHPFMAYQEDGYSNLKGTLRNLHKWFKNAEDSLQLIRGARGISHPFMGYQKGGYSNLKGTRRMRGKRFKNAKNSLGTTRRRWHA